MKLSLLKHTFLKEIGCTPGSTGRSHWQLKIFSREGNGLPVGVGQRRLASGWLRAGFGSWLGC